MYMLTFLYLQNVNPSCQVYKLEINIEHNFLSIINCNGINHMEIDLHRELL